MQRPSVKPAVLFAPVADGYVAYDPALDRLHQLNPVAALIAELCDGRRTVEEIHRIVEPLLPAGKAPEVERWVRQGLDVGLLTFDNDAKGGGREFSGEELCELAARLWEHGKVQTAFLCQKRASELKDDDAEIWCSLGELAHIVGRREEARTAYEKCLELNPEDAEIKHFLIALRDGAPPARVPDDCIRQLYQRFSSFFESNLQDELDYQGPKRIRDLVNLVTGNRNGVATLDLGCGSGLAGAQLKPISASMVGIDLSPEMIELARNRDIYDALEVAEITSWLLDRRRRFDIIVACDTLIYFGDLRQVLVPAAGLVEQGGIIAFSVELGDRRPFHLTDSGRYAHDPDHIREVAADAGLSIARMEEGFLRMEYGAEVTGLFVALQNKG
jgi:predicted TPR repeat methyltransferase